MQSLSKLAAAVAISLVSATAYGQLQITELISDSLSPEPRWEWVEVRNAGGTALDLNGYVFDDINGNILGGPNINSSDGPTMVPAGGVAVLYNGSQFDNDPQIYRDAWQLSASVPMIAVSAAPSLNNGADHLGFWSSYTAYEMDSVDDGMGTLIRNGFANTVADFDYGTAPGAGAGISQYWLGTGSYQDGANWATSQAGVDGATTSIEISVVDAVNSIADVGNPGIVPAGPQAAGLIISEIMYNPRSPEADWEWIEVVNNTGGNIDFGANGYFLDDLNGTLAGPNVASGSIADGQVAVLFNDEVAPADFATAWGAGLNAIPVSDWGTLLNNGGDTIGLWSDAAAYAADDRANLDFDGAEVFVTYDDDGTVWVQDDGNGSISLTDLTDAATPANWALSAPGDALSSFNASPVGGIVIEHLGGDVGSPGSFGAVSTPTGDFDGNGVYECADVDGLVSEIAAGTNNLAFDLTGDGAVDDADLTAWLAEAGSTGGLTASGNPVLPGDANLDGSVNGQDFVVWNASKFTATAAWCSGDFNADGSVDGQDFVIWNSNKFMTADAAAVPEPSSPWALLVGVFGLWQIRRK
jgi:hypothetical protein